MNQHLTMMQQRYTHNNQKRQGLRAPSLHWGENTMKVVLKKSKTNEPYTFSFVDGEYRAIVRSESYREKKNALKGIASVKNNCMNNARYEMKESRNGKFFFNVKARNGQVVGTSALYESRDERRDAVERLKIGARDAITILDEPLG
ncbi:MAG: YegP family protein [Gammaproteobacteria bacterium]|nr:YegP family protein [Gammaproteobacteria bacterium]